MPIYRLDDGSTWHFVARDAVACREQWLAFLREQEGCSELDALADFGEPEITLVPLPDAEKVTVIDDEDTELCPTCNQGQVPKKKTLGDWFREDHAKPPEKRAKYGALCNSEWP